MASKQHGFAIIPMILGLLVLVAISSVGILQYRHEHPKPSCEVTEEMKKSGLYDVPCEVGFMIKNDKHPSPARINQMVHAVNGTMKTSLPDIGVYYIKVPAGTEEKSITYLKSQPEVDTALHNDCCTTAAN